MEVGRSKQLVINVASQIGVFLITSLINFFLTPFVVKSLGVEAFGFVGLSTNIIGYLQIATVALNAMAGRYISIEYYKGDVVTANKFFSSVFFSNLFFSLIILVLSLFLVSYLEYVVEIPLSLLLDVKLLFVLLTFNSLLNLVFNVFNVSTFIRNRIDISSVRNLISNLIRLFVIVFLFSFFTAHLWYIGCSSLICSIYLLVANVVIKCRLTPDLKIEKKYYDYGSVKKLMASGVWQLMSRLGDLLQRGFDLLFANWFVGAIAMGILSITTQLPFVILQIFSLVSNSFAPSMTRDFAEGNMDSISADIDKSIKVLSLIMLVPLSVLYVYGDVFYSLWVPGEDAILLQRLTIMGTIALIFTSPLEGFWNVFVVTDKVKGSSIFMLVNSVVVFVSVLLLVNLVESVEMKMFVIAGCRSFYGIFRGLFFLPIYAARCLKRKWNFFYPMLWKPISCLIVILVMLFGLRFVYMPNSWFSLFYTSVFTSLLSLLFGAIFILDRSIWISFKKYLRSKMNWI